MGASSSVDTGLPRAVAAEVFGVSPHVISMWASRGWTDPDGRQRTLTVVGTDHRGHRLYSVGDISDAEKATARSPRSHRHRPVPSAA